MATLTIPFIKFVSSRSVNVKDFEPPIIDIIILGSGSFHLSKICWTISGSVSISIRAYYININKN